MVARSQCFIATPFCPPSACQGCPLTSTVTEPDLPWRQSQVRRRGCERTLPEGDWFVWLGIGLCLIQSGLFSGLNLALLGLSRLQLEVESRSGSQCGRSHPRPAPRFQLPYSRPFFGATSRSTALLTLLSESVLFGVGAFLFSTVGITMVGEIFPQAYFSRNAMRVGARLVPFVRFYQVLLFPVAKPTALLLDRWLGAEEVNYFRERELREVIRQHMLAEDADLEHREGLGAPELLGDG